MEGPRKPSANQTRHKVATDDEDVTSVEGTMKYLQDLGLNLESADILVALEIVQAPSLG
jgi:DCN1-like protein 1/2